MDNFLVFGSTFDKCLNALDIVLQRCESSNLILNWEKCHLIVQEGIVLGHMISRKSLEVNGIKIEVIEKLHNGFYGIFNKEISKITKPLENLLGTEVTLKFDEVYKLLKSWSLNWHLPLLLNRMIGYYPLR